MFAKKKEELKDGLEKRKKTREERREGGGRERGLIPLAK